MAGQVCDSSTTRRSHPGMDSRDVLPVRDLLVICSPRVDTFFSLYDRGVTAHEKGLSDISIQPLVECWQGDSDEEIQENALRRLEEC
jgi:hypothetical protein